MVLSFSDSNVEVFVKQKWNVMKNSYYGKYSKISNTFLILFSNKMLVSGAGIHKILVILANREDPDQTASKEVLAV